MPKYMSRLGRRTGYMLLLMILVVASLPTLADKGPHPLAPATRTDLPDSSDASTPVVAEGHLVDHKGEAVQGEVFIQVWPDWDYLDHLPPGTQFKSLILSRSITDKDGKFTARLDPRDLPEEYVSDEGWVTVWLLGFNEGATEVARWTFTAELTNEKKWQPAGLGDQESDTERGPARILLALSAASSDLLDTSRAPTEVMPKACYQTVNEIIGPYWAKVGEAHAVSGATADFQYFSGGSTTLGVGYSVNGGAFSQTGISTKSHTFTIGYPTTSGSYEAFTQWRYRRYVDECWNGQSWTAYEYRYPYDQTGGANWTIPYGSPATNYCSWYAAGTSHTNNASTAVTWSGGVNVGGFSATTRSGYNSGTQIHFEFQQGRHLCGDTGYPNNTERVRAWY